MLPINNQGDLVRSWTFDGTIPGPLVRVTEGDTVVFTLENPAGNRNAHSMDFHAARVDVTDEFAAIEPGETKTFTFTADYPGVFLYHCGASPMILHIAMGMFGVIIVDPKDGDALPAPDREYVLVQSEHYENPADIDTLMQSQWTYVMFNGQAFKYDPLHDPDATRRLEARPGERVRIYFVNAGPNEFSSFHPIGGIWDKVFPSGNPDNAMVGLQSYTVGPGDAAIFDLISPREGSNAVVTHSIRAALSGAIAVIDFDDDADDEAGRGDNLIIR